MITTSHGLQLPSTIKAANVVAGRAYVQQQFAADASQVFTVLDITDTYKRTSISTNRLALVRNAAGENVDLWIYGNQSYIEIQPEQEQPMSDVIITSESTETKSFEQQMREALAQVEVLRTEADKQREKEKTDRRAARIAKVKPFTDWLGIPGEVAFDEAREAPFIVYQGITFLIHSSVDRESVFVDLYMFREVPFEDGFHSNWTSLRHEIDYRWEKLNDETRNRILAEIAEYIPRINDAYTEEMKRYEAWKKRVDTETPTEPHTIMFWHALNISSDLALSAKIDAGYRVISTVSASDAETGVYVLLSKHAAPTVKHHTVDVGHDF